MKRPVVAIASLAFAIVAAALSAPFLLAAIRHPSSQDTPIWLALGTSAALSSAFAIWSCIGRAPLSTQTLAIRALICMAFAFPAALLLGAFASNPP
jgi:hypothetical protein